MTKQSCKQCKEKHIVINKEQMLSFAFWIVVGLFVILLLENCFILTGQWQCFDAKPDDLIKINLTNDDGTNEMCNNNFGIIITGTMTAGLVILVVLGVVVGAIILICVPAHLIRKLWEYCEP